MANDILPLEDYPVIPFMLHHMRNPFPQGDIVRVRPLQEQLNKTNSKLTAYLSKMTSLNVFVPIGSGLKKDLEDQLLFFVCDLNHRQNKPHSFIILLLV